MRREELVERVVVVDKDGRVAWVLTPYTDYVKVIEEAGSKTEDYIVARLILSSYGLEDAQLLECNVSVSECWEKLVKAVAGNYGRVVEAEPW